MRKDKRAAWEKRPLATETLPYEVPVIFANDKFYLAMTRTDGSAEVRKALDKFYQRTKHYTQPYQYSIKKDSIRTTQLSIIHPLWQLEICDFYASHEGSLLSYCNKSIFSLRRPVALASLYSEASIDQSDAAPKSGVVESQNSSDNLDASHFVSYFVYGKYNLLSKFYSSSEFIKLEKRFRFMRTLDISKCFYHIYTHSLSWAVKSKEFSKENSTAYSFEGRFDQLMQKANYNETNGIVVGPEISRIFAEIILQRVDVNIERALAASHLIEGRDYTIRRYVDDYAVFGNGLEQIDLIQDVVAGELAAMKLYLNEKKIQSLERPFVTPLTLARMELENTLAALDNLLSDDKRARYLTIKNTLSDARANVVKHKIEFGNVSGWILSTLNRLILRANGKFGKERSPQNSENWAQAVRPLLELAFHLCALDLRVRTTYNICQIIASIYKMRPNLEDDDFHSVEHSLTDELIELVFSFSARRRNEDAVELYNILICGVNFLGKDFAQNVSIFETLRKLLSEKMTYFKFITLNFCFSSDEVFFSDQITYLNGVVAEKLRSGVDFRRDSEQFLLFADYLSSPLVDNKSKRSIYTELLGGSISAATMNELAKKIGFVDWSNINVDHLLRRKALRPVYAMA